MPSPSRQFFGSSGFTPTVQAIPGVTPPGTTAPATVVAPSDNGEGEKRNDIAFAGDKKRMATASQTAGTAMGYGRKINNPYAKR